MEKSANKYISDTEKEKYMNALNSELPFLRAKANISQGELAKFIGVSRQTLGAIERCERPMGWNTYLSLIFFFDNNKTTRQVIRSMDAFPHDLIESLSEKEFIPDKILSPIENEYSDIFSRLDEQAIHSIRTLIMIEYARCTNQPGVNVVKSFDGMNFMKKPPNAAVTGAIKKIKENSDD